MLTPVIEGFGRQTLRSAVRMPKMVARRLFGPPPENDRGTPLDEQVHIFLSMMETSGQTPIYELELAAARKVYRMSCRVFDTPGPELDEVTDYEARGPRGEIPVRVYRPHAPPQRALPALVFYHGGGFVIGCVESYDNFCRTVADSTESVVISVDYRLAPEHSFPAPIDDCVAAYQWVEQNARGLGVDPTRIAVGGDSAGATLSTVVCQELIGEGASPPAYQLLMYPTTDSRPGHASREHFSDGYFLTRELLEWFASRYVDGRADLSDDPRVSPILFDRLGEMPPATVVTAGFDPLRDEGEAYAKKLEEAGVPTRHISFDRLIHGFVTMGGLFDAAARAVEDICEELRREMKR